MDRLPAFNWPAPADFPMLAPADVHVWCAWLDTPGADDEQATAVLSPPERTRAAAFHFAAGRRRYTAAHAMVRRVLARYLTVGGALRPDGEGSSDESGRKAPPTVKAADLEFVTGPSGKPALADGALQFNLSHSGPLALLAVARDQAVGIDVEQRWEMPDLAMLEERMFTPAALRRQQLLGPGPRLRGFYRRWTQLEAIGKCRGTGLELERLTPGTEHLAPADPAEGFTGCLACERPPVHVAFHRFTPEASNTPAKTTAPTQPILPGLPHRLEGLVPLSST